MAVSLSCSSDKCSRVFKIKFLTKIIFIKDLLTKDRLVSEEFITVNWLVGLGQLKPNWGVNKSRKQQIKQTQRPNLYFQKVHPSVTDVFKWTLKAFQMCFWLVEFVPGRSCWGFWWRNWREGSCRPRALSASERHKTHLTMRRGAHVHRCRLTALQRFARDRVTDGA